MRVYELAKEYDTKSTEFVGIVQQAGVDAKSHLSSLDDAEVDKVRTFLNQPKLDEFHATNIGVKEPLEDSGQDLKIDQIVPVTEEDDVERPVEIDASFIEEESETEEFNGVEVDEQLNPVDEMEDGEEETDTELSFGQQAFARAKELENDEDVVEIQEVIVEKRPTGFWSWLTSLFT